MIVGTGANSTTSKQPIRFEQTLTAEFTIFLQTPAELRLRMGVLW